MYYDGYKQAKKQSACKASITVSPLQPNATQHMENEKNVESADIHCQMLKRINKA